MAGISLLRKLLMKQAVKKSGQASGIMSIGSDVRKLVEKRLGSYIDSAQRQGVDLDKMSEQELKYILELNKPKGPMIGEHRVIDAASSEGQGITRDLFNMLDRRSGKNVIKTDFGGGITDDVSEIIIKIKTMEPMDAMKEANRVLKGEGRYKSLSKADRKKIVDDESITDHIFERNIIDETEDFAQGGRSGSGLNYLLGEDDQNVRVPYAGGGFNKARRAFLKWAGAGAAGIGAAKSGLFGLLKAGKAKSVIAPATHAANQIIETPGMPYWFKPLVNKVIKEGDDVTKKFATQERQIVHNKKLGDPKDVYADEITVTQELDTGNVRVEYHAGSNMGDAPIQLDYKAGEIIEQGSKKGKTTKPEFSAVESEPRVVNWDGDIEWDGENVVNVVDDLLTDTTKLETYATGKKPNIKKLLKSEQKQKYVNKLHDDQMEQINYIENKHGHIAPEDLIDEGDAAYHKYKEGHASGGRVPLVKGKIVKGIMSLGKKKKKKLTADDVSQDHPLRRKEFEEELFGTKEQQESKKFKEKIIKKLEQYHKLKYMDITGKKGHAFGGRVPLAEGNTPSDTQLEQYYRNLEEEKKRRRRQKQLYEQRFGGPGPVLEAATGGLAGMLGE